jgi:hypothetical protein
MMPALESFEALKGSALGIIFLGTIGSLVAAAIAFSTRYVTKHIRDDGPKRLRELGGW